MANRATLLARASQEASRLRFTVLLQGRVIATDGGTNDDIGQAVDNAMNELVILGIIDPTIDLDLESRAIEIEVAVDAVNPFGAMALAHGAIRTALHAANIGTPDWPTLRPEDGAWGVVVDHVSVDPEGELIDA